MNKNRLLLTKQAGCLLAALLWVFTTGCLVEDNGPGAAYVGPDDFVYYPAFELYYGSRSHEWYGREGSRWVAHPAPAGISVETVHASPSVAMTFHDNPAAHHAEVVKSYPKSWTPAGRGPERKDEH